MISVQFHQQKARIDKTGGTGGRFYAPDSSVHILILGRDAIIRRARALPDPVRRACWQWRPRLPAFPRRIAAKPSSDTVICRGGRRVSRGDRRSCLPRTAHWATGLIFHCWGCPGRGLHGGARWTLAREPMAFGPRWDRERYRPRVFLVLLLVLVCTGVVHVVCAGALSWAASSTSYASLRSEPDRQSAS